MTGLQLHLTLVLPICIMLLINTIILGLSMYKIMNSGKNLNKTTKNGQNAMKHIKAALTFTSLLGLTYIFGILAVDKLTLAFQWLFCIFNSLQGFCIFYFSTLTNKDVKKAWRQKFEENKIQLETTNNHKNS